MSTTIRSTTGTAPISFTDRGDGTVRIDLADGSTQVYRRGELLAALVAPAPTDRTVVDDGLDLVIEDDGDFLEMSGDGMAPWSFAPKDAHRLVVALLAHTARLWDDAEVSEGPSKLDAPSTKSSNLDEISPGSSKLDGPGEETSVSPSNLDGETRRSRQVGGSVGPANLASPSAKLAEGDGLHLDDGRFLPYAAPRTCMPWCDEGDGHPREINGRDRTCYSTMSRFDVALYPSEESWGRYLPQAITTYATDRVDHVSFVQVSLADADTLQLLPDEARTLAAHLLEVADLIEPA